VTDRPHSTLLLALGNDILGDDGIAPAAARRIEALMGERVHVVCSAEAGLALLELMEGYDQALLLDSTKTGLAPVGHIHEFPPEAFSGTPAPSPHYVGLPEVLALAVRLGIALPDKLRILAMEVENPYVIREVFSPDVAAALPEFVRRAVDVLRKWVDSAPDTTEA
jgi:hydrogenase maturation protease